MPSVAAGNTILEAWTVFDQADPPAPLTGMLSPADVTLVLMRQSGSTLVAASETVTWTESSTAGRYYLTFTPQNTGLYVLYLQEIDAATLLRATEFRYDVYSAGSILSPSYANAFCSESDIKRWLQQTISSTTRPSDTEATAFAQGRAGALMSLCNRLGYPVTPTTVTAGSRLETLLREANSIGAALDYTLAQAFGTGPSKTDRATWLDNMWQQYVGRDTENGKHIMGTIESEICSGLVSLATDHILSGDTLAPTTMTPTDIGIQVTMSDLS